jgi:hypothetical protein
MVRPILPHAIRELSYQVIYARGAPYGLPFLFSSLLIVRLIRVDPTVHIKRPLVSWS